MPKPLLTSILLCSLFAAVQPQALVQDSLVLSIQPICQDSARGRRNIEAVHDMRRTDNPRLIGIDEVTKLLFIPVDRRIKTTEPLTDLLHESIPFGENSGQPSFTLELNQFDLSNRPFLLLFKKYQINSLLTLYHRSAHDSLAAQGQLLFDCSKTEFSTRSKLEKGYVSVFHKWLSETARDVPATTRYLSGGSTFVPYNFRPFQADSPWQQLYAGVDAIITGSGYQVDGQLFFNYPEVRPWSVQSVKVIRYRHDKNFDSIEYGLFNIKLNYRFNRALLMQVQSDVLLGINRWKNMGSVDHELNDALIGDFSVQETLCRFPKNGRTALFGVGLFQNLYYIDSYGFNFRLGLLFKIGMQL